MGVPAFATQRARLAHPRRGLGIVLVLVGAVLVAPGLILAALCNPIYEGICLPQPYGTVTGFVAGVGFCLMILGPLLVFTRWQFARNSGFCPTCGADIQRADKFCGGCGSRLW
jgi:hypothetical protein